MEGPEITFAEATIDNGSFGTRTVRFETGRLAKQAGGAVSAYLDEDTMLLSTTTAGKHPREGFDFFPLTDSFWCWLRGAPGLVHRGSLDPRPILTAWQG